MTTCNNNVNPLVASMERLSVYVGPVPGGQGVNFYKRHIRIDQGTFTMTVKLDTAAIGGEELWWHKEGNAVEGTHYTLATANPVTLAAGQTEITFPIVMIDPGAFFLERRLDIVLDASPTIVPDFSFSRGSLWMRASVEPPTISLVANAITRGAGAATVIPVQLSAASAEDVTLNYTFVGDMTDYTLAPSGTLTIPAGDTSATIPFTFGNTASSGEILDLTLHYERETVVTTIQPLNSSLLEDSHLLLPQRVHIDENMWTQSVGGVQGIEQNPTFNIPPDGVPLPAVPESSIGGGTGLDEPGTPYLVMVDQLDSDPFLDPFSGIPLKRHVPGPFTVGTPYIRKSFQDSFCLGPRQLYALPEYLRVSYYIRQPHGADASKAINFFTIGFRNRSKDLNHNVTWYIGTQGKDRFGDDVTVYNTSIGNIGLWDLENVDEAATSYGLVEDANGVRVWFTHHMDSTTIYQGSKLDIPGDDGNPIERPTHVTNNNGSLEEQFGPGANYKQDVRPFLFGNMQYGMKWEISDTPFPVGEPTPYWPKAGQWWEPEGLASISSSNNNTIRLTVQ